MTRDFASATFGSTGVRVRRLGLSATYWPGKKTIYKGLDNGVNLFFLFGFDRQMVTSLRDILKTNRQDYVVVTGAYNYIWGYQNLRKTLEKRLRQLHTDYIDAFLFLGVTKQKQFPERARDEMVRFREEGKVRTIGVSTHDRAFAGQAARDGILDTIMMRYNAAHRGAETEIFPNLAAHNPAVISYTATRWRYLLRRPKRWPKEGRIPTAPECYRFVLSNPNVDVCLTAPSNLRQFEENLTALEQGPLTEDDMAFMRQFGDAVHDMKKWFM
ncbi:MAG TPA: aldo/keto reductase [Candidatus Acidoferrum sp.]|nr:aldo/keto reductase [Candidatus Acidoferrum sp.]